MGITVAALAAQESTFSFEYLGETVAVTYRLGAYTLEFESKPLIEALAEIIVAWDVLDGDAPYPTTVEALGRLPEPFLWEVAKAMREDVRLGPTSAGTSGAR